MKLGLFIPTLNAGKNWEKLLISIDNQDITFHSKIVVDSGSKDNTLTLAAHHGWQTIIIPANEFDHGKTRNLAIDYLADCEIIIYLTQDVILYDSKSISSLIKVFSDPLVACAYGRQIPHSNATPLAIHARLFNYPDFSFTKSKELIPKLGFKTCFVSNSFSAYRTTDLIAENGFPTSIIFAEDAYLISRFILNGKKISYVSEAKAYHSHNYTTTEEFKRYFDIGVFHKTNHWITNEFGSPKGEGLRYIKSELKFAYHQSPRWIFACLLSTLTKFIAYQIGKRYYLLTKSVIKKLSLNNNYWK